MCAEQDEVSTRFDMGRGSTLTEAASTITGTSR